MKALLWKDCRINRVVLVAVAVGFLLPYFLGSFFNLLALWRFGQCTPWCELLTFAAFWSMGMSSITITFLSGNAVAGERADRFAEFLACLPVPRRDALLSRILIALAPALLVWLIDLVVAYSLPQWSPHWSPEGIGSLGQIRRNAVLTFGAATVLAFGVAWLCTARLPSPAVSAAIGLLAPFVLFVPLALVQDVASVRHVEFNVLSWFVTLALPLGLLFFAGGCGHYLRRVEP